MAVRAVRGAIQVDRDDQDEILGAVAELVEVLRRNDLDTDDLVSILFTATDDLHAEFLRRPHRRHHRRPPAVRA